MEIFQTIIPIFSIIILGWLARLKGFMPVEYLGPANRLVYFFAIPAMVFRAISKASLKTEFNISVLSISLFSIVLIYILSWIMGGFVGVKSARKGTFIQSSGHGNLGYIGLAVAFYYLGDQGLVKASIIAGFVMVLQNVLSVIVLQLYDEIPSQKRKKRGIILKILGNPVIVSVLAGFLFALTGLEMPVVIDRSLSILSQLALPTALLIIGATLSFEMVKISVIPLFLSSSIKLLVLPCLGLSIFLMLDLKPYDFLPALILLASPTATIAYVMAKEMNGDPDFAVAVISLSTILSAFTFIFWLNTAG